MSKASRSPILKKLSSKIFISFTLLFSLSLVFVLLVEMLGIPNTPVNGYIKNNQINTLKQLNIIADLEKFRVLEWVHERKLLAKVLANNEMMKEGVQESLSQHKVNTKEFEHKLHHIRGHLSQIIKLHNIYEKISIVNVDSGKVIISNDKKYEGTLFNDLGTLRVLSAPAVNEHISLIENTTVAEHRLIIMRKILIGSVENIVLAMQIDVDKVIEPLLNMGNMLGKTGDIVVFDDKAHILFALKHRYEDGKYAHTMHTANMAALGEEGFTVNTDYRGVEVVAAYRYIMITSELSWGLVVKQDYDEVNKPLLDQINITLYSAGLMLLMALILIFLLTKKLTDPLTRLTDTLNLVKSGNLKERVVVYNQDDIGKIGLAVNGMLEEIEAQHKQLNLKVEHQYNEIQNGEARIHELAFYDSLTQLPNRTLLIERLDKAIARAKRSNGFVALLLLDLDNFKSINESLSHQAGDQLLQQTALLISRLIRNEDIVARISSDEFVVVIESVGMKKEAVIKDAEKIALKFQAEIAKAVLIKDQEIAITIGVGIAISPEDADSSIELLKAADIALYRAKTLGRENIQFFAPEMKLIAEQRLAVEMDLRHAIAEQQFELYYQTQVDVLTGLVVGAEALIRWNHPVEGLVSPFKFIQIAEETGLIIPLGSWVLQSTCQQIKSWENAGYFSAGLQTIAANISAVQFQQDDFVDIVSQTLQSSEINPSHLEIELTESLFMGDYDKTRDKLNKLKELGVCLTIDDFGTGYSSLSYLKKFPLDVLKIDRSFVMDIVTDPNDAAIVQAIAVMAKTLNLKILAEGVETEEQLDFIRKAGCEVYQGYLYSKPIPVQEIVALFQNR